jgi:hypothetical protein
VQREFTGPDARAFRATVRELGDRLDRTEMLRLQAWAPSFGSDVRQPQISAEQCRQRNSIPHDRSAAGIQGTVDV